jgi:hypothetical protein
MSDPVDSTPDGVLACLADDDCRAILRVTHTARTAPEISECCDIPLSTVYRKVDRLTELSLLDTRIRIDSSGRHPTQYQRGIDSLLIQLGPHDDLSVSTYRATSHETATDEPSGTVGKSGDEGSELDDSIPVQVEFVGDAEASTGVDDGD